MMMEMRDMGKKFFPSTGGLDRDGEKLASSQFAASEIIGYRICPGENTADVYLRDGSTHWVKTKAAQEAVHAAGDGEALVEAIKELREEIVEAINDNGGAGSTDIENALYRQMNVIPVTSKTWAVFKRTLRDSVTIELAEVVGWRNTQEWDGHVEPLVAATQCAPDTQPEGYVDRFWNFSPTGAPDKSLLRADGTINFFDWLEKERLLALVSRIGAPTAGETGDGADDGDAYALDTRPNLKAGDPADAAEIDREIAAMLARFETQSPAENGEQRL